MSGPRKLIALDGDGVLLDYHEGYALAWQDAFGERPSVGNPEGYHPMHYWDTAALKDQQKLRLFKEALYTHQAWSRFPALPGATAACDALVGAGYTLVCVSALNPSFRAAREANLAQLGFPLSELFLTGSDGTDNPKRGILAGLKPLAMLDDYLGYLQGLEGITWRALVKGRPAFNPNRNTEWTPADSVHDDLQHFAAWWLAREADADHLRTHEPS